MGKKSLVFHISALFLYSSIAMDVHGAVWYVMLIQGH